MKTKYPLTITLMAFLALLLTGCGGSSSMTMQERAVSQTAELKDAYDKAKAALDKLQDDTSDATEAEVVAVEEALETLKEKIAAAKDVSDEVKAMYSASAIETGLVEAKAAIQTAIGNKAVLDAVVETAKTASTNADTAADGAETETMGVVAIQTPHLEGKYHKAKSLTYAKESRAAATMAMEEYEKTRTAAAAGNRTDAEAARRKAEEQAQIAADKAAEAKKAVAMEVKYSDGTYSVGEVSITPAKLTEEGPDVTVNGTTVNTGLRGGLMGKQPASATAAITYQTASGNTLERKAKPKIERRAIRVSNYYVTANGKTLFSIFTHYFDPGTVNAYRATSGTVTTTVSDDAPNGEVDHDDDDDTVALKVMKATGDFYETTGSGAFDNTNPASATIEEATKKADAKSGEIYYYMNGDTKVWLQRDTAYTGTGYQYKNISVVENVKGFPLRKAFQHVNFGLWSAVDRQEGPTVYFTDMGIGFVRTLPGAGMTGDAMPASGTATYDGFYNSTIRQAKADGMGVIGGYFGSMNMTADFDTNTLTASLYNLVTLEGVISGDRFSGTTAKVKSSDATSRSITASQDGSLYTGTLSGGFFGPDGVEVGGVFDFTSEGKVNGEFRGSFGARRKEWERY